MRHSSSSWFGQLGLILGLSVALSGCAVDPRDAGDDIVTGTPGGVGAKRTPPLWMKAGDRVEIEIDRVGLLQNLIVDEA